jgi:acyl-CoA reductase-like NAD-dependent aldehyde dehydrogenase
MVHQVRSFLDGDWRDGARLIAVADKFTGRPAAEVHEPDQAQVDSALRKLAAAQQAARWTSRDRFGILSRASALLADRREEFIGTIVADSGFTRADGLREVDRAVETLLLCGEEAKRLAGDVVPLHGAPGPGGRIGFTVFRPLGVVCAITPFNSPLNTVVHKIGPALAAGNAVVLKPASLTPATADALLRLLLEAGLPPDLICVVHGGGRTAGQWLLDSQVPAFYAFTGSTEVGAHLQRCAGLRRTQLELGSLSSTVICQDADLDRCLPLCVNAAFRKAGQVCTSVQRLYVDEAVADAVTSGLAGLLADKKAGDPADPGTFIGPLISPAEADRVSSWIRAAAGQGATVVCGGTRSGNVIEPTVLADVAQDMLVMRCEVFGPVVLIRPFTDLAAAVDEINDTPYGLAAGIFTRDLERALLAAERLRMGAVHVNETSSSRVDLMPYTGVKESGLGREGPRYAIREMSEECLITIGRP